MGTIFFLFLVGGGGLHFLYKTTRDEIFLATAQAAFPFRFSLMEAPDDLEILQCILLEYMSCIESVAS